jgi:hypothetical protein
MRQSLRPLDAAAILDCFNRHGVRYVVIGAFAAIADGAPLAPSEDIDFTPEASSDNLDRLSSALRELGARIRTDSEPEGLPFSHDGASLGRVAIWNLTCKAGDFDLAFRPSGFDDGYDGLVARSRVVLVDGVDAVIADLRDVIASKQAAGRPKDIATLPTLEQYARERPE